MIVLLAACDKDKKIVVMSKGAADINTDAKTIKATDGASHEEKTAIVSGNKVVFNVTCSERNASSNFARWSKSVDSG